jgi:heme oxygenase
MEIKPVIRKTGSAFIERLKEETGPLHKSLEQLPLSTALVSENISAEEYKEYLRRMYAIMQDVEDNVFPLLEKNVPDLEQRKKKHLLEKDFDFLKIQAVGTKHLPVTGSVQMMSPAYALGILYVTEGSTLGGRVIMKNIQSSLGLTSAKGAAYFTGYGESTGILWKEFIKNLELCQEQNKAADEVIAGAKSAFTAIYNYMK